MALPYDLVSLDAGPDLDSVSGELRRLGNRVPIALVGREGPEELAGQVEALGVPISWSSWAEASDDASPWSRMVAETGLPADRILHVARLAEGPWEALRRSGHPLAWWEAGPAPDGPWRHTATGLAELVDAILALDEEEPDDPAWDRSPWPNEYLKGIRCFNRRQYYEAHEYWEILWKTGDRADADFYRGLIQYAVATLHWERGNEQGAELLYAEGRRCLIPYIPWHLGLDVLEFMRLLEEFFEPFISARSRGRAAPEPDTAHPPQIELDEP